MTIKNLTTSIGEMEYSIYGKGEPVLFIHGGHSNAKDTLTHKHIDPDKFTLITPSRPGYGYTPLSTNRTPLDASRQIMELMDVLKIHQFNIIGISAGGLTAIALASQFPDRVKNLVLASAISKRWLYPDDDLYKKGYRLFNPKIEKYTWKMMRLFLKIFPGLIIKKMKSELSSGTGNSLRKEDINDLKLMLLNSSSGNGFITDLEHDLDADIIKSIKVPTFIVHSNFDKAVSVDHAIYANEQIENSRLLRVDNEWGHLIWLGKESKSIIDRIVTFLQAR